MPVGKLEEVKESGVKINGVEYEITENARRFAEKIRKGSLVFYRENNGKVFFIRKFVKKRF